VPSANSRTGALTAHRFGTSTRGSVSQVCPPSREATRQVSISILPSTERYWKKLQ
jgi:hypothetical protein